MKKLLINSSILIALIALLSLTKLDILFSKIFFDKVFLYENLLICRFFYKHGMYLPIALSIFSFLIFVLSFIKEKYKKYRIKSVLLVVIVLIGPGLITQELKKNWPRPRPIEIKEFKGTFTYRTPFNPNFNLRSVRGKGNSFPSGHAAIGFYLFAFYLFTRKRKVLEITLGYGIIMGLCRVVQGKHFLSDVIASFLIIYFLSEIFCILFLKQKQ
jgi:lipid A 4'-phosphatase